MKYVYKARIKAGQLEILDKYRYKKEIGATKDMEVEVVISKYFPKRTDRQNAYYWANLLPKVRLALLELHGEAYQTEEVHEFLKARFNYTSMIIPDTGEVVNIPKSTTNLTTKEFTEYLDKCKVFCIEYLGFDPEQDDLC